MPSLSLTSAARALACASALLVAAPALASHYVLSDIPGFSPQQVQRLQSQGIRTTRDFLQAADTPSERQQLARQVGMDPNQILAAAQQFDLLNVEGIGPKMARLLHESGVLSLSQLAQSNPESLELRMEQINGQQKISEVLPPPELLQIWIQRAQHAQR